MNTAKLAPFTHADQYLACPVCQLPLQLQERSLVCENGHCYDIAKQGYVNLAPAARASQYYQRESFAARGQILRAGFYNHIREAVVKAVREIQPRTVLDAGCGEGFYARALSSHVEQIKQVLACDLAKESVLMAAREDSEHQVLWFVANLAQLPVLSDSVDCIIDVFSPVNYQEFARVLGPDGVLVKVIPGANHDIQLRETAADQLRHTQYSNDDVVESVEEHAEITSRQLVSATLPISQEEVRVFAQMTPLLFNADLDAIDYSKITEITIEAEVIIARDLRAE